MKQMFKFFKNIYCEFLPAIVIPSITLGMFTGMTITPTRGIDLFINTIGFTSIGMITGLTFPISFPLLGGYVLYTHLKK
jgi:hypothetical protein